MECPHCQSALPSYTCPECEKETPAFGPFCCHCGTAAPESNKELETNGDSPVDFSERVLCSDGTCIGLIGKDGTCKECGKPYAGEPE